MTMQPDEFAEDAPVEILRDGTPFPTDPPEEA